MVNELGFVLIFISFISGVLTILAPCVLPLLPIIIGFSIKRDKKDFGHKPLVVISSFMISVVVFSLLLKRLSEQFGIYQEDLVNIAWRILILFWLLMLFPEAWHRIMHKIKFEQKTWAIASWATHTIWGDIVVWVILGPLLQSCSPTYGILLANILPGNYLRWVINIIAYVLWLGTTLLLLIYGGRKIIKKIGRIVQPHGVFKRILWVIIVFLWFFIVSGYDKDFSLRLATNNLTIDTSLFEYSLLESAENN